ncbi:MAG TPA: anthrone oxygenase family protein [Actinophytocola sp.]|uniref:anthrone oxygenase family protein n=1 Tax=Actinophytocola sp. TaxID=1872138 RepID=UPI002DDD2F06|nr:anthrone oxygenase family protein [Actinophytocola sp.]HEV2780985.1 anthrone oxygenase family protein [Actinophytocola sp.]
MIDILTFVTALCTAIAAGVFFAFSTFIMAALRRMPAPQGIAAMQSINVTVLTPLFMIPLFGAGLLAAVLAVVGILRLGEPNGAYLLAGSLVYLLGTPIITIVYHVPRNNALDRLDPSTSDSADQWARYLREWTGGNHVRTLSSLAATGLLIAALLV